MSEENNSQEFKSVSPTTTEANYKAFNGSDRKKKSNGAGFGKVVILPFVCGVLGATITLGACINVPSIKQAFLEKLVSPIHLILQMIQMKIVLILIHNLYLYKVTQTQLLELQKRFNHL